MAEGLKVINKSAITEALSYSLLIHQLRASFTHFSDFSIPQRHHHSISSDASEVNSSGTLLLMPAWSQHPRSQYLGVKIVTVFPENGSRGLPAVAGSYLLSSSETGRPLALIDGTELTLWRTACASALAADYLARKDVKVMVMVGAGALAPHLISAHLTSRPSLQRILVWNRTHSNALQLVKSLKKLPISKGKEIEAVVELESAVRCGDLITCATLSSEPLVLGLWLSPGAHLDLVGSFTPSMRECDDEAVRVARIFVDTEGAIKESGDLDGPLKRGVILEGQIVGTLPDLVRGKMSGRRSDQEITLFKSVGSALEDLAAAQLVYEKIST